MTVLQNVVTAIEITEVNVKQKGEKALEWLERGGVT